MYAFSTVPQRLLVDLMLLSQCRLQHLVSSTQQVSGPAVASGKPPPMHNSDLQRNSHAKHGASSRALRSCCSNNPQYPVFHQQSSMGRGDIYGLRRQNGRGNFPKDPSFYMTPPGEADTIVRDIWLGIDSNES
ncbi:Cytochrome P450 [Colletotrichum asianum]